MALTEMSTANRSTERHGPTLNPVRVVVWLLVWTVALFSAADSCRAADVEPDAPTAQAQPTTPPAEALLNGYATRIDARRNLKYISALDEKTFRSVNNTLSYYVDLQKNRLFPHDLQWQLTVILPTVQDYRKLSPVADSLGIYLTARRTLMSISLSSVLVHEFTHALHHNDQVIARQAHAIWVAEGLATLFQSALIKRGVLRVQADPGLATLQQILKADKARPLAELCAMNQAQFLQDPMVCYLQAQYLMYYLRAGRKLNVFYETYKRTYRQDPTGVAALEKTLQRPIAVIDEQWRAWILRQPPPWRPAKGREAHLGLRMRAAPEGVKVMGFIRNSAAARGEQIRRGDVIISLAGRPTPTPAALTEAVLASMPGESVEVELIRDGRTTLVKQLLGARAR